MKHLLPSSAARLVPGLLVVVAATAGILPATARPDESPNASPIAALSDVNGTVLVVRADNSESLEAEVDTELFPGDEVRVSAKSDATISFVDRHLVRLNERTNMVVKGVRGNSDTGSFWGRLFLKAGSVFASLSELTGEGAGFEVETGSAVAAVKGTTFAVEASGTTSTVSVLEGSVLASGISVAGSRTETVTLGEGQETSVDPGTRKPGRPRAFAKKGARKGLRDRLVSLRTSAREHRRMRGSGELKMHRHLRHLARTGRLGQASPELRQYLRSRPDLRDKLKRHADRHDRIQRERKSSRKPPRQEKRQKTPKRPRRR